MRATYGVLPRNHIRAEIRGPCVPCPRARAKRGHGAYYPKRYTDWHDMAQVELVSQCGRLLWADNVLVGVTFYGARANADIDNLLKSVLDAMTGVIYEDDVQVQAVRMDRQRKGEKGTVVEVTKLPDD